LRKLTLSSPTIETTYIEIEHYYYKFDKNYYYYKQTNDFETITISDKKEVGFSEVSFENTRLKKLYQIEELKDCFKEHNIATQFNHKNILLPIVYNNFYKGAIGEVFGKYILEKFLDITLQNLSFYTNAPYELFDFTNTDESVYFDFKYYSIYTASNIATIDDLYENIQYKLKQHSLTNKKVFIINLFVDEEYSLFSSKIEIKNNIYFIPYLVNLNNTKPQIDINMLQKLGGIYGNISNK